MNRTQIISLVLSRCGRQETNTYLVDQAKLELGLIQERLEGGAFMPWFLLAGEITSLTTTANQRYVTLLDDFLREYEDFPLYRYDAAASDPYTKIVKDEFDILEEEYSGASAGPPVKYALLGDELHFFPTPDAAYPLRWNYFKKAAVLSDSTLTNVWTENATDLLVAELGYIMAGSYKRDTSLRDSFGGDIVRSMGRLIAFDEARKQALRDAQRGS